MAKRTKNSLSKYKRKRTAKRRGILGWIVRLLVGLILLSVLWVLAYRFVNPPITATMVSDLVAGRGAERQWMGIEDRKSVV